MELTLTLSRKQARKELAHLLDTRDEDLVWAAFNKWRHEFTDYEHKYRVVAKTEAEYQRLVLVVASAALDLKFGRDWDRVVAKWVAVKR